MENIEQLIRLNKYEKALLEVNSRLEYDSFNLEYLTVKAHILSKMEKHLEAIDIHNTLINLLPSNAEFYANRGLTYHHMGESKHSLGDFSKAVDLEPENGYRYSSRAFIKDYIGDLMGALADYNKAVELDPEDAISLNNRGLIEEKLGRMQLAQESFSQADKVSGINIESLIDSHEQIETPKTEPSSTKKEKFGVKYFLTTLSKLFTSQAERKAFCRFLLNRK